MASHSPLLTSENYATLLTNRISGRLDDSAKQFDPAFTSPTNVQTNTIRWNSSANRDEKWDGTTWNAKSTGYAINITGSAASCTGNAATVTNGVYTTGTYTDPAWLSTLASAKIIGDIPSAQISFSQGGTGSVTNSVQSKLREYVDVKDFGAIGDGTTECGAAIRLAMAKAVSLGVPLVWSSGTYVVAADPASPLAGAFRTYCLKPANNAVWIFQANATIKLASGAQSWCRLVSFQATDNVQVFGQMRVDASVSTISGTNNEHMHGVFIFDTTRLYIQSLYSFNARGDNLFIGGTNETTFGNHVHIGSYQGVKAGRKNLTFHYCDNLRIDFADLDNSTGGASAYGGTADGTDKHCLDVEPDDYTGAKPFAQSIGSLKTYGLGNDFTAGTTPLHGDNWTLNIGDAVCRQSGSSATVKAWEQNAITINVGSLQITGCAGIDQPVSLAYAARLNVNTMLVQGATLTSSGHLIDAPATGGDENRPKIRIGHLTVKNTVGNGFSTRSGLVTMGTLDAACVGYALTTGENVSTAAMRGAMVLDHLITRETGAVGGEVVNMTTYSIAGYSLTIRKATVIDTRGTPTDYVVRVGSGNAAGLCMQEWQHSNLNAVACNWLGTDKHYRVSGGSGGIGNFRLAQHICYGTPQSMIVAPTGSTAQRIDGAAGTSFYVKETNTGASTGWVGK